MKSDTRTSTRTDTGESRRDREASSHRRGPGERAPVRDRSDEPIRIRSAAPRRRIVGKLEPVPLGGSNPRRTEFLYARSLVHAINERLDDSECRQARDILKTYLHPEQGLKRALDPLNRWLDQESVKLPLLAPTGRKSARAGKAADEAPAFWDKQQTPRIPLLLWTVFQSPVLRRIKKCVSDPCPNFFVDEGKALRALYCSTKCASRAGMRSFRARLISPNRH